MFWVRAYWAYFENINDTENVFLAFLEYIRWTELLSFNFVLPLIVKLKIRIETQFSGKNQLQGSENSNIGDKILLNVTFCLIFFWRMRFMNLFYRNETS